ncbi:resolvase, partial [Acinetobacter lwoffii]|nr:resolvase [Acinetobacter lwoffii]
MLESSSRSSQNRLCQRHFKIDPFYLKNGEVKLTPLISY